MQLPDFPSLKLPAVRLAFLTLAFYMATRAINAIIAPASSKILEGQPQTQGNSALPIDLDFDTFYVSNSVLFPIILVILYRLAHFGAPRILTGFLGFHYLSVVLVLAVAVVSGKAPDTEAYEDEPESLPRQIAFTGEDGRRYMVYGWDADTSMGTRYDAETLKSLLPCGGNGDAPIYVKAMRLEYEGNRFGYDPDEEGFQDGVVCLTLDASSLDPAASEATSALAHFLAYYWHIAVGLLTFLSVLSLPYFYRLDYAALAPGATEQKTE